MKLNCKGFVLLETLIVAVFIIGIFTFLYSSVIPLLGNYEDLTNKSNIDIVYKLYHMRKLLYEDTNFNASFTSENVGSIKCDSLFNKTKCSNLVKNYLDMDEEGYQFIYVKDIKNSEQKTSVLNLATSDTLKKYINNYSDDKNSVVLLYDEKTDSASHLAFTFK